MSLSTGAARFAFAAAFAAGLMLSLAPAKAEWRGGGTCGSAGCGGRGQGSYPPQTGGGQGGTNNIVVTYSNPMWPFVDFWGTGAAAAQSCLGYEPVYNRAGRFIGHRRVEEC